MDRPSAYDKLAKIASESYLLENTSSLLSWDHETYLPKAGNEFRAQQSAYFSGKIHSMMTSKRVGDLIAECEAADLPKNGKEAVNIREWRYAYDRETKLPRNLVTEFARTRTLSQQAWTQARETGDFSLFQEHLQKILDLTLQKAKCWGYEDHPYDALLQGYERGATTKKLDQLFSELQPDLVSLVEEATTRKPRVPEDILKGRYPEAKQKAFNGEVARALGFDFDSGRIDTAVHPFCTTLGPQDVRLTTRYHLGDFTSSLFGVLHEAGHGMYEQGLPENNGDSFLPISRAISLGIHESQSRLWENHIGRSHPFWKKWLPAAAGHFSNLSSIKPKQMFHAVNRAERSYIRVEADEVTYDLHIILRFRIEKALVSGELSVADLPGVWNETFQELFGLKVKNNSDGCLQDVHWSFGLIGYFPTYSLGNINASQLYQAAMKDTAVADGVEKADYAALLDWLRKNVHRHGTRYLPNDLMKKATGEMPNPKYLLEHLRERYL